MDCLVHRKNRPNCQDDPAYSWENFYPRYMFWLIFYGPRVFHLDLQMDRKSCDSPIKLNTLLLHFSPFCPGI